MDYKEYLQVLAEYEAKAEGHDRLRQLVETKAVATLERHNNHHLTFFWDTFERQIINFWD